MEERQILPNSEVRFEWSNRSMSSLVALSFRCGLCVVALLLVYLIRLVLFAAGRLR